MNCRPTYLYIPSGIGREGGAASFTLSCGMEIVRDEGNQGHNAATVVGRELLNMN